jgi:predicted RND superfamily exporter protein
MTTLGALAIAIDKAEVATKANLDTALSQQKEIEKIASTDKSSAIAHHYKRTETHTIETDDQQSLDNKDTLIIDDKEHKQENAKCGCFGMFKARKK